MDITPESLRYNAEFNSLSHEDKTRVIEAFAKRQPEELQTMFIEGANRVMEDVSRQSGQGRVKLDKRINKTLSEVLPTDFNYLERREQLRAIDIALTKVNERVLIVDPVNRNDTAYYVKDHLILEMRKIGSNNMSAIREFVNRYYGEGIATLGYSLDELKTKEFLARYFVSNPYNDRCNFYQFSGIMGRYSSYVTVFIVIVALIFYIKKAMKNH